MKENQQFDQYSYNVKKILCIIFFLNLLVLLIKVFAGIVTKSLSIFGDAAHSGADTLNNLVGLLILKYASEPPDKKHPYGHGKYETLAAFAIIMFLAIAFAEIVHGSLNRLINPVKLPLFSKEVVWLLIITFLINLFVWIYERKQGLKFKSNLLIADSSHTGSDVLITMSVLASQFFIAREIYWVDPIVAILIAFFIAKAGFEIFKSTVPILLDEAWLEPEIVSRTVLSVSDIKDCYDIYSRRGPHSAFIECTVKVVPKDLFAAHKLADKVEEKLKNDFGDCKVTIHIEPDENSL